MLNIGSRKALLARLLCAANIPAALIGARGFASELTILAYHRVLDRPIDADFAFDAELVSASSEDFAWQMQFIQRRFTPMTFAQLQVALAGGEALPPRPIIVTFDDGFEDNYRCAFPILRDLGVPATFFISTDYIGGETVFWFDAAVHWFVRATRSTVRIDALDTTLSLAPEVGGRRRQADAFLRQLKGVPDAVRRAAIEQVRAQLAPDNDTELPLSRPLNWAQVREMAAGGMEFGSHTVSHPLLTQVTPALLDAELAESKQELERQLGRPCNAVSYPDGAVNPAVMRAAADAGYDFGVGYFPGINKYRRLDRFSLNRLHIERYTTRPYFAAMLAAPAVFMHY